jgi:tripartite-type tricarboxylate transporter receptor subunit TctC
MAAKLRRLFPCVLMLGVSWLGIPMAEAQNWPDRPIKMISSQAAGGATDVICRIVAEQLSRRLGQQVVVENRPGGGNVIGTQAAARSAPDGYTLFFATGAALVADPYTYKSLPYDPTKDFVVISRVAEVPFMVLAHPSVPANNLAELIALAKSQHDKLSIATDGPRRFSGMIVAWLNKLAGTSIAQVPYTAMPQGVQDTIAGRVQLVILAVPAAAGPIAAGSLRPLAVTALRRLPGQHQNVPTIAETFPGFDFTGWFVMAAPTGTPADIQTRVNREIDGILKDPAVVERIRGIGFNTEGGGTQQDTRDYVQSQYRAWGTLVREIGLQPE